MSNNMILSEATGQFRMVAGPNEFFDILENIKPGQFMTFGYVTAAKLDYPKKKVLNPATKRMNTVDDYETFSQNMGSTETVNGVIKLSVYNMQWQDKNKFNQRYKEFKDTRDSLNDKYGFSRNAARYQTQTNNFGNGVKQYAGNNADLAMHTYTDVNMYNVKPISTAYYLTYENGNLAPVDKANLPFPAKKEVQTLIQKLMSVGATEEEVAPLKNFDYKRFEHSQILFLSATVDGIPTLYINTKLSNKINGLVNVKPETLVNIAKERYPKYTSLSENKDNEEVTHLTEGELKRIIKDSVIQTVSDILKQ